MSHKISPAIKSRTSCVHEVVVWAGGSSAGRVCVRVCAVRVQVRVCVCVVGMEGCVEQHS